MGETIAKSPDDPALAVLTGSQLFQDYQRAFEEITGLPLALSSPAALAHRVLGPGPEHPFCTLMTKSSEACAECQKLHESLTQDARSESRTLTCFAGLCETAIPVRVGERLVAFMHTGQVMTRQPTRTRFNRVAKTLLEWGADVDLKQAEEAWFATRVLTGRQYDALVKLLEIFARHLAACGDLLDQDARPHEPEPITKARHFIAERSADDLSLGTVARVANMSANYFSEKFKEITGIRFVEYVSRTRVEKACCLLRDVARPVTDVAYDVGFRSLSQFNRAFRQFTGLSPSAYRGSFHNLG